AGAGDQRLTLISTACCPVPYCGLSDTALAVNRSGPPFVCARASEQTSTTRAGITVNGRNFMGRELLSVSSHSRRVPGEPRDVGALIRSQPWWATRGGIRAHVIG